MFVVILLVELKVGDGSGMDSIMRLLKSSKLAADGDH
jgi:hypothetical protein